MWQFFYKLASPKTFYQISGKVLPWATILMLVFFCIGLMGALFLAPADYQQGDSFRIIYIHVPSAILSMGIYVFMAVTAAIGLIWRFKLSDIIINASAPIGASLTFLALITGSLWGKPMWGTWWIWDARLTSELILLFLYFGYMATRSAIPNKDTAARASSILLIVGVVNIPVIHYSVFWWNTLHQGATILRFGKPAIHSSMLWPLLVMIAAFICYFITVMLHRARCELLTRESDSDWVRTIDGH